MEKEQAEQRYGVFAIAEYFVGSGKSLAIAESLTEGLLTDAFVSLSGASEYLGMGVVTYSNEAKTQLLGVRADTLRQFGAVSEQTAREMAQGVKALAGADVGLSTTGIAGPNADGTSKPIGLVYIGLSDHEDTIVKELLLPGSREEIRSRTVLHMMDLIREYYHLT